MRDSIAVEPIYIRMRHNEEADLAARLPRILSPERDQVMLNARTLLLAALASATCAGAFGQNDGTRTIRLARFMAPPATARRAAAPAGSDTVYLTLRGGAMVSPRGAGLAGVDFSLPSITLGTDWHGRVDADVIFKANLGGVNTIIPATFDLLHYDPTHRVYFGGGAGAVFGGNTRLDAKLILGTELVSKLGAEVNLHFTERNTLVTILARIHLR